MITRMWEARTDVEYADDAAAALAAQAGPWAAREVYLSRDQPGRLVVISHWADETALSAYAGSGWRTDASAELAGRPAAELAGRPTAELTGPPRVWHFTPVLA